MKRFRLALALLIVGGALVASPAAGGGGSAIPPECNCWYWQTDEHGEIISTMDENGEIVEECETTDCARAEMQ